MWPCGGAVWRQGVGTAVLLLGMSGDQLPLPRDRPFQSHPVLPLSDLQAVVSAHSPTHRETETLRVMSPKAKRQFGDLGSALLTLEHPLDAVKKTNIHSGSRKWTQAGAT